MKHHMLVISSVLATALALALAPAAHAQTATSTLERVSSFEYDADGLLIKEVVEPDRPNDCLQTTYLHDGYGNRVSASSTACVGATGHTISSAATARTTTTTYASQTVTLDGVSYTAPAGAFATSSSNALGQSETKEYDPRHGGVTKLTGPNGLVTTWAYDGFGRKTRENRADGTYSVWAYKLCQVSGQPRDTICPIVVGNHSVQWYASEASYDSTGALLGPIKYQFHDTLERVVRVQTQDFQGDVVVQDTHYNVLGQVSQKSILYRLSGGSPHWSTFTYDAIGRVKTESTPDGNGGTAITRFVYDGLVTTVTNPQGQTKTTHKNASGQTTKVVDHLGGEVLYSYDALGQLLQTSAAGAITQISYSRRGYKQSMQDPAMGAWDYAYNAFGELVWQQDSLSQTSIMAYDVLGRMTQRTEPDLLSRWYYDAKADGTACGAGIGKLCEATANNGYRRVHAYDAIGRPTSTATALDSPTNLATVSQTYHPQTGRLASKTWPTGYRAAYVYNSRGYLSTVTGGGVAGHTQTVTLEVLAMSPQGQITQYKQGNNVTTVNAYDEPTGKLHGVQATLQGQSAGNVLNHSYSYDKLGNLLTRNDANTGVAESFQYDALNRLSLYTALGGGLSGVQSVQTLYDRAGNLKYKSDVGYYHHDALRPNRLNHVTLAPESNWSAMGAVTQANTGTRALSYAFDDTRAGARSINTPAGAQAMGNGNLWYTVSQDQVSGRHTVRWETYTSFNMPKEMQFGNLAPAQTSIPATINGYTCPADFTLSGTTCTRTDTRTAAATPIYACPSGFTRSGTTCSRNNAVAATPNYSCDTGVDTTETKYIYKKSGDYAVAVAVRVAGVINPANGQCRFPIKAICQDNRHRPQRACDTTLATRLSAVTTGVSLPSNPSGVPACTWWPGSPYCLELRYNKLVTSYSCPAGTTLSGTNCVSTTTQAASIASYSCPAGTVLSGSSCVTTTTQTLPASPIYTCPSGGELSGSACLTPNPTVALADRTLSFAYGPEHQRIRQTVALTSNVPSHMEAGTTWYLNGTDSQGLSYEKEIKANGTIEHKHYVNAGGMSFALYVNREGNLNGKPATTVSYLHHDHLGSVAVLTNEAGAVTERMAFDPWGKRRNINGTPDPLDALYGVATDRGYTMHEHLDEIGVIHMNGRIYDPLVGRFMSADPFIQYPANLQSFNRYSYVLNNPLSYTDPSGYFLKKLFKSVVVRVVAAVADAFGCAGYCSAAVNSYYAYKGGGVAGLVASFIPGSENVFANAAISAGKGCAVASLSGGNCGRGAGSALIQESTSGLGPGGNILGGCLAYSNSGGSCGEGAASVASRYLEQGIMGAAKAAREFQQVDDMQANRYAFVGAIPPLISGAISVWNWYRGLLAGAGLAAGAYDLAKQQWVLSTDGTDNAADKPVEPSPDSTSTADKAKELGYDRKVKDPPFNSHGQPVFTNGKDFITPDVDQHNGGEWKGFDRRGRRTGTYDENLDRIGK